MFPACTSSSVTVPATLKLSPRVAEAWTVPAADAVTATVPRRTVDTVLATVFGDTPHTATAFENGKFGEWDTGPLGSGESKRITFDKPGTYYYICTPHPWMYGQVIVEP